MQMIDVLNKLKEIESRSPEELNRAIDTVAKLNTIAPKEQKVVEAKLTAMPDTSNGSYMVDVLNKLRELESRSPEMANAIANASKMGMPQVTPVAEGIEIKTNGDDAILAQILKLAGMVGGVNSPDMTGSHSDLPHHDMPEIPHDHAMTTMPSVGANLSDMDMPLNDVDMEVDFDMDKDKPVGMSGPEAIEDAAERPYTNSPHEMTKGISAAVPKGNGIHRPKGTYPKVAGGDNPTHVAVSFD